MKGWQILPSLASRLQNTNLRLELGGYVKSLLGISDYRIIEPRAIIVKTLFENRLIYLTLGTSRPPKPMNALRLCDFLPSRERG